MLQAVPPLHWLLVVQLAGCGAKGTAAHTAVASKERLSARRHEGSVPGGAKDTQA